jgi:7-cyano-7-deazaguanine reductase
MTPSFRDALETFDNPCTDRDYTIEIVCPEFTSLCPKTGQPDFGMLTFTYTPDRKCVELKSLKLYLQQYRNEGIFYENVTNRILTDLVAVVQPRHMKLVAAFHVRGGITTTVTASYDGTKPEVVAIRR